MASLSMIDEITGMEGGKKLCATRRLRENESYLADHFPGRPVMPGVLMLEALFQAASWLARVNTGFRFPITVLVSARSVRYVRFVEPGERLMIEVELLGTDGNRGVFRGRGTVGEEVAVSGRFEIEWFRPEVAADALADDLRKRYRTLSGKR